MSQGFIPPHGGFEDLHSYKKALIIDAPRMLELRALGTDWATYETYRAQIESDDPEIVGNAMVCLCAQTCYLLDGCHLTVSSYMVDV